MHFASISFDVTEWHIDNKLKKATKIILKQPDRFYTVAQAAEAEEDPQTNKIKLRWVFRMVFADNNQDAVRYVADDEYAINMGIGSDSWESLIDQSYVNFRKKWNDLKKNTPIQSKHLPILLAAQIQDAITQIHNLLEL